MASSSVPPTTPDLSKRGIRIEPVFDKPSFEGKLCCNVALETIQTTPALMAFDNLPRESYPRLVRAFYETLKVDTDGQTGMMTCEIMLDRKKYIFTSEHIASALGIFKGYKPIWFFEHEITMREALAFRPPPPPPPGKGIVLRESHLHENFWLVDKYIKAYVCPYIHDNEIPQYLYKYWYTMYKRKEIDVPALMIECMLNARDGGRTTKKPHPLVLPRAITTILKRCRYPFRPSEPKDKPEEMFDWDWVKKSIETLATKHKLWTPPPTKKQLAQEKREAKERAERDKVERDLRKAAQDLEERRRRWGQGREGGSGSNPPSLEHQGEWDANIPRQEPPPSTWGSYSREQHQPQPPQDQWQNQMYSMMQGYGTMLEGMQGQMQGMNLAMHEGFQRFDTRFDALEAQVGLMHDQAPPPQPPVQTYQRSRRRRHFISTEEEQDEPME